jgi:hypothetical protein
MLPLEPFTVTKGPQLPYPVCPDLPIFPVCSLRAIISPIHSSLGKRPFKGQYSLLCCPYSHWFRDSTSSGSEHSIHSTICNRPLFFLRTYLPASVEQLTPIRFVLWQ